MIASLVITAYLNNLRSRLIDFPLLERIQYDPNLAFDTKLRKYIVNVDNAFKIAKGTPNWLGLLWNREALKKSGFNQRRMEATDMASALSYNSRLVDLPLTMLFVSPSIGLLETLEEFLVCIENNFSFKVNLGTTTEKAGGLIVTASVSNFEVTAITKEDTNNFGSIATIGASATLTFTAFNKWMSGDLNLLEGQSGIPGMEDYFDNECFPPPDRIKIRTNVDDGSGIVDDAAMRSAIITVYFLDSNNNFSYEDITLSSTDTFTFSASSSELNSMCGFVSDKGNSPHHILQIYTFTEEKKLIWYGSVIKDHYYGALIPMGLIGVDARLCRIRVTASRKITGTVVVDGLDGSWNIVREVMSFNDQLSKYTEGYYYKLVRIWIGAVEDPNLSTITFSCLVEGVGRMVTSLSVDIYHYGSEPPELIETIEIDG